MLALSGLATSGAYAWSHQALAQGVAKRNASLVGRAHAEARSTHKLYVVNGSNLVGAGEDSELLEIDTGAGTVTRKAGGLNPLWDYLSQSAVCGDMFYAVATNAPVAMGLLALNLTSGEAHVPPTESKLTHAIQCGATAGTVNLVMSEFTTPPTFSLRSYNVANSSTTLIGEFPTVQWGGWDSIFTFRAGELWAAFPVYHKGQETKVRTGELYVMDISGGKIKSHKAFPKRGGEPYYVMPANADGTFGAVFTQPAAGGGHSGMTYCTCDASGADITTTDCADASEWWHAGDPPAVCADGTVFITPGTILPGQTNPMYQVDPKTGALTHIIDIDNTQAPDYRTETKACFA